MTTVGAGPRPDALDLQPTLTCPGAVDSLQQRAPPSRTLRSLRWTSSNGWISPFPRASSGLPRLVDPVSLGRSPPPGPPRRRRSSSRALTSPGDRQGSTTTRRPLSSSMLPRPPRCATAGRSVSAPRRRRRRSAAGIAAAVPAGPRPSSPPSCARRFRSSCCAAEPTGREAPRRRCAASTRGIHDAIPEFTPAATCAGSAPPGSAPPTAGGAHAFGDRSATARTGTRCRRGCRPPSGRPRRSPEPAARSGHCRSAGRRRSSAPPGEFPRRRLQRSPGPRRPAAPGNPPNAGRPPARSMTAAFITATSGNPGPRAAAVHRRAGSAAGRRPRRCGGTGDG